MATGLKVRQSNRDWRVEARSLGLVLVALVAGFLALVDGGAPAAAANDGVRLLMVEEAGCRFCARFDAEIGKVYDKSAEGRFAPLVRVGRDAPELAGLKPAPYTPTFIVLDNGEEKGRITGYPGEIYFWQELAELLLKVGYRSEASAE